MTVTTDAEVAAAWITDMRAGNRDDAARTLWNRYFDRIVRFAQRRLPRRLSAMVDAEDVALSVFDRLFRDLSAGRFPRLAGADDLWRLLVVLTIRRIANLRRRECRQKRGGGRVLVESDLAGPRPGDHPALAVVPGREPAPDLAIAIADDLRQRFAALNDESLQAVALLRVEGYTNAEIATALGVGLRSVERMLDRIRRAWEPARALVEPGRTEGGATVAYHSRSDGGDSQQS